MKLSVSSTAASAAGLFVLLSGGTFTSNMDSNSNSNSNNSMVVSSFQIQSLTSSPAKNKPLPLIHKNSPLSSSSSSSSSSISSSTSTSTRLNAIPELTTAAPTLSSSSLPSISTAIASPLTLIPQSITAPLGSLSVLAFVILIHELGHFLAARSFNINVQEFSVGVGPKLLGFRRNVETGAITFGSGSGSGSGSQTETGMESETGPTTAAKEDGEGDKEIQFNLRAIPLGGYVRFPENYNMTEEFQLEVKAEEKREEIQRVMRENSSGNGSTNSNSNGNEKDLSKGVGAGLVASISNIFADPEKQKEDRLLALKIISKNENKKSSNNNNNNNTSNNWWNALFNKKDQQQKQSSKQERTIIINEEDGTVSTPPIEYYDDPNLLQNRGWGQRAVVLAGGVVFNLLLAFTLYFGELTVGGGMLRPTFDQGAVISAAPRADGPSAGILNRGDVILSLNGQPLSSTTSPSVYKSQEAISQFISKIRTTTPGEALHLSVLESKTKSISEIDVYPSPMNAADPNSPMSIGVMLGPNFKGQETIRASSVGDALSIASIEVYESTSQTAQSILTYLGTLLQGKGGSGTGQSLSGPIGVIKTGSDVVATNNISAVIGFMAAISINLAVVNALPLPALDGGQMMFVLAEAVTGRKVDQRVQESINSAALLFLLVVTFSTAIGDISKIAVK